MSKRSNLNDVFWALFLGPGLGLFIIIFINMVVDGWEIVEVGFWVMNYYVVSLALGFTFIAVGRPAGKSVLASFVLYFIPFLVLYNIGLFNGGFVYGGDPEDVPNSLAYAARAGQIADDLVKLMAYLAIIFLPAIAAIFLFINIRRTRLVIVCGNIASAIRKAAKD